MTHGILVVEDEPMMAKNIKMYLERFEYDVRVAKDGKTGRKLLEEFKPDLILMDLQLPDVNGLDLLAEVKKIDASIRIIIMTAHGNVQTAVEAMKAGAHDYLSKPLVLRELKVLIDKAFGQNRLEGALSYYQKKEAYRPLLGESPEMAFLTKQIRNLNESEGNLADGAPPSVLITGETGTGKELIARSLHYNGPRKSAPFIEINCASIPNNLLESELFGHERGAFTDAKERKRGLFEAADRGTLFLDEIGEVEIGLQAKLLKALEEKVIRRLGSLREQKVDVRIIAATNQSLEELVRAGKFRADLFFRLSIIRLESPPLRTRGKDILLLANHFLQKLCKRYRKEPMHLSERSKKMLLQYDWPGNVRELRNIIEQAVFMSHDAVVHSEQMRFVSLAAAAAEEGSGEFILPPQGISIEDVERDFVTQALERSEWNVTRAAKLLGLSRHTLRYRIEKYDLVQETRG
ncbi:MAG: sigma-54-dependent transcriptional regulator [Nitrospiria bacterium]